MRSPTLWKEPRRIAFWVMMPNQRSTRWIHQAQVEVQCRWNLAPPRQALLHLGVVMSAVVINNEMNIQMVGYSPVNLLEEGEEFLVAVAVLALRQHFPRSYIQDSKQRCGAVTDIIMDHTFHSAQSQRYHGLGSLQCLELCLLA